MEEKPLKTLPGFLGLINCHRKHLDVTMIVITREIFKKIITGRWHILKR